MIPSIRNDGNSRQGSFMGTLHLGIVSRNGEIVSRVHQGSAVVGATILFPKDHERNLPEATVTVEQKSIWELVPFGAKDDEIAKFVRATPIGTIDANILYGPYRVTQLVRDPGYVQSPFFGRWDGDDLIVHLRHRIFETEHRVRANYFRFLDGVLTGQHKDVIFDYGGSFSLPG